MSTMTLSPDEIRRLVRRDVAVTAAGVALALVALLALAATRLGYLSALNAGRVGVALTAIVAAACLYTWASGPPGLLRERAVVLSPLFLIAGPGLYGVHTLGGGLVATMLSGAVGVTAAVALGMAWSVRRRNRGQAP